METLHEHWQRIYATKQPHEVSWTQEFPKTSLAMIDSLGLARTARIIDIGGGDSRLADHLLDTGYENVSVLDISEHAIDRARKRLGERAQKVNWIVSDVLDFRPTEFYDLWHDRATFHFLTKMDDVEKYVAIASACVRKYLVIGTFSIDGPAKCSGLDVTRYSAEDLTSRFRPIWHRYTSHTEDHTTPFGTEQNFLFCTFARSVDSDQAV